MGFGIANGICSTKNTDKQKKIKENKYLTLPVQIHLVLCSNSW